MYQVYYPFSLRFRYHYFTDFNGHKFRKNVFNTCAKSSISKKKLNFALEFYIINNQKLN
jgi:hypothetical protein